MGILDGIVEWIATQVMNILDMINTSVLGALGCDMETFLRYFPAAETFYTIMVAIAIGLLLLNMVFQLFRNFGIFSKGEAEEPISLTVRTMLFIFLAIYSNEVLDIALEICGTPYKWLMTEELPPLNFADFNSVLLTILGVSLNGSIALIALILLVILAWNYLKLLFEAAERYVLLGVLTYTAPVAFSMGGSQNTANIFKSWCRMLAGQLFMILMNVWCLRIFTSMFANFISNPLSLEGGNFFIWFLCAIAFLKISQKIDGFMQMLGINVGKTGGSMLGEAAIALKALGAAHHSANYAKMPSESKSYAASGDTFLQGGLVGSVGRQINRSAINNITGKDNGIGSNIARSIYNSSVQNGGTFSSNVIGTVAHGDISRIGSIKGNDAVKAFQSYMGGNNLLKQNTDVSSVSQKTKSYIENNNMSSTMDRNQSAYEYNDGSIMGTSVEQIMSEYHQNTGEIFNPENSMGTMFEETNESVGEKNDLSNEATSAQHIASNGGDFYTIHPSMDMTSKFSQVEIGGGRITGIETSDKLGGDIAFAMYSSDQYIPPIKGDYKVVEAVDGSKWYHQYAQPTVVKEPYMKEDGKVYYSEHIENKLPEPPKRKDKI